MYFFFLESLTLRGFTLSADATQIENYYRRDFFPLEKIGGNEVHSLNSHNANRKEKVVLRSLFNYFESAFAIALKANGKDFIAG